MDKANGEMEMGAEVGRAVNYRGLWISSRIHREFDEEIWKSAADHVLEHYPSIDDSGRPCGPSGRVTGLTAFLGSLCRTAECDRLKVNADNYGELFRDAQRRGVSWKTHLQAALLESVRLGLTLDAYIVSLGLSNPNHSAKPSLDQAELKAS